MKWDWKREHFIYRRYL